MYNFFYTLMMIGYLGLVILSPDSKSKMVGLLLFVTNGIIFWR